MRPPVDHIEAPAFPARLPWINVAPLRMDQQRGRPVLIEFWDFCRPNSMRTLPYVKGWHERYEPDGLRVIGVHSSGFPPSVEPEAVEAAVARLEIAYPVVVDIDLQIWQEYGNLGWPARYLFNQEGRLFDFHYGEGGYDETEAAIQELLGVERALLEPLRPEDAPGAVLVPQSEDVAGPYSGPYEAGRRVGGPGRRRDRHRQRARDPRRPPRRLRADHPPREHHRRARARHRRRRDLPRRLLHPRSGRPGSNRLSSRGGPSSSRTTQNPVR